MTRPALRFANSEMLGMAILAGVTRPDGSPVRVVQSTSTALTPGIVRVVARPGEPSDEFESKPILEYSSYEANPVDASAVIDACWWAMRYAFAKQYVLDDGARVTVDYTDPRGTPHEVAWPGDTGVRVYQAAHLVCHRALPLAPA